MTVKQLDSILALEVPGKAEERKTLRLHLGKSFIVTQARVFEIISVNVSILYETNSLTAVSAEPSKERMKY